MKRKVMVLCLTVAMTFMVAGCSGKDASAEPEQSNEESVAEVQTSGERVNARLLYFTTADKGEDRLALLLSYYNPALAKYGIPALSTSDFVESDMIDDLYLYEKDGFRLSFLTGSEVFNIVADADVWEEALPYVQAFIDCTSPTAQQAKEQVTPAGDVRLLEEGLAYETYLLKETPDEWSYSVKYEADEDKVYFASFQGSFGIDMPEAYI